MDKLLYWLIDASDLELFSVMLVFALIAVLLIISAVRQYRNDKIYKLYVDNNKLNVLDWIRNKKGHHNGKQETTNYHQIEGHEGFEQSQRPVSI